MTVVERGQIWSVNLGPTVANEQSGVRPCLVVSANRFNALPIEHAIVVPLTSRERRLMHHVPVVDNGGLRRQSWAMCEALRAVSMARFGRLVSTARQETLDGVTRQLRLWLLDAE